MLRMLAIRVGVIAVVARCPVYYAARARAAGCEALPASCTVERCVLSGEVTACARPGVTHLPVRVLWLEPWLLLELGRRELVDTGCGTAQCIDVSRPPPSLPAGRELSVHGAWTLSGGRALTLNLTPAPGHCAPLMHLSF